MTLGPWLVWYATLALINLFVFLTVRGRWGRITWVLALASVAGVAAGDAVARGTGLEVVRIGDMHIVAACVGAQVLMIAVTLLAALGPVRVQE